METRVAAAAGLRERLEELVADGLQSVQVDRSRSVSEEETTESGGTAEVRGITVAGESEEEVYGSAGEGAESVTQRTRRRLNFKPPSSREAACLCQRLN